MAAGWSDLPLDILFSISTRITDDINILRFRSVCSSWRSSCPPPSLPPHLSYEISYATTESAIYSFCVHTRSLLLVKPVLHDSTEYRSWLIKSDARYDNRRMKLYCPLSAYRIRNGNLREKVLDVSRFRVFQLGHENISVITIYRDHHSLQTQITERLGRLALIPVAGTDDLVIFAQYLDGNLAIFRPGDTDWTVFANTDQVADLASFNGLFYAIDKQGTTFVVDQYGNLSWFSDLVRSDLSSQTVSRFLVESEGELLLVDICFATPDSPGRFQFRMYKLNPEMSKWDQVELVLGSQVLFLGEVGSFSVSNSQLGWPRGNFIYFGTHSSNVRNLSHAELYGDEDPWMISKSSIYVYDLEKDEITSLDKCYPELNLFSPPHEWFLESKTLASTCPDHRPMSPKSSGRHGGRFLNAMTRPFKSMFIR